MHLVNIVILQLLIRYVTLYKYNITETSITILI
jgi:hypothetical protein